jgi:hypothetical protein
LTDCHRLHCSNFTRLTAGQMQAIRLDAQLESIEYGVSEGWNHFWLQAPDANPELVEVLKRLHTLVVLVRAALKEASGPVESSP